MLDGNRLLIFDRDLWLDRTVSGNDVGFPVSQGSLIKLSLHFLVIDKRNHSEAGGLVRVVDRNLEIALRPEFHVIACLQYP